jgi:hypothetical protein
MELSGEAHSRNTDPGTSQLAADSMQGSRASELEGKVLAVIQNTREHPAGLTGEEVTVILGLDRVTTSPRFAPLCRKGLIHDSGIRRIGSSNRPAIVWLPGPSPDDHAETCSSSTESSNSSSPARPDRGTIRSKIQEASNKKRGIRLSAEEVQILQSQIIEG